MQKTSKYITPFLLTVAAAGLIVPSGTAQAGAKGRKNTAIGLGAAAAHQLLTGKTTNGLVLGAGTAYAYQRYKAADRDENRSRRARAYRSNAYRSDDGYLSDEGYSASAYRSSEGYGGSSIEPVSATTRTRRVTRYGAASPSRAKVTTGTFVFTGPLADSAGSADRAITVDHNGILRRAEVPSTAIVTHGGQRLSVHDLRSGDIVRVTAVQTSPNRWRAARVEVVDDFAVDNRVGSTTRVYREEVTTRRPRAGGADIADVEILETTPLLSRPYSGVGIVQRVEGDGTNFDVRIGSTVRTIYVIDTTFAGVSNARALRRGDRVRVMGHIEGRDVVATRVTMLD